MGNVISNVSHPQFDLGSGVRGGIAPSSGGFAPNRPAGLTNVLDRQWSSADNTIMAAFDEVTQDSAGMVWADEAGYAEPTVAASPTSYGIVAPPDSATEVLRVRYPANYTQGRTPFKMYKQGGLGEGNTKYYHACYVYWPASFDMAGNNLKWLWFAQGSTPSSNHLFMMSANNKGSYVGPWSALQNSANANLGGGNRTANMGPIVTQNSPQGANPDNGYWDAQAGKWTLVEWYVEEETVPGVSNDGIFKAWSDDVLICHYDEVQFNMGGGFRTLNLAPYYGGGGLANGPASNQDLFIGRFLVATAS